MKTIGIYGGSFNPIHIGHRQVAECVIDSKLVDEVWFMPCYKHNGNKQLEHAEIRLEMCKLAVYDHPQMFVCDYEIVNKTDGKMFNTMTGLMKEYNTKYYDFRLIIGGDCLSHLGEWYRWQDLTKLVNFIVVSRNHEYISPVEEPHTYINADNISNVSSTEIRSDLRYGSNYLGMSDWFKRNLHPKVVDYILKHNLYRRKLNESY
jgi:nicotinate-nucleotide adenylyltransferase